MVLLEKDFILHYTRSNSHVKSYPRIKCIYKITNIKNGLFYIGYTNDFFRRMKNHIKSSKSRIDKEIQFIGKENFMFEIVFDFTKTDVITNTYNYKYHIFIEQKFINDLKPFYNDYKL